MTTHTWEDKTEYSPKSRVRPQAIAAIEVPLLVIGRAIFGAFFFFSGLHHFIDRPELAAAAAGAGVPYPDVAILATGALLVMGGVGLLSGLWPRLGAAMIIVFLIGVTPVMHAFWNDPPGPQHVANMMNFFKNVGLLGGAFIAAAIPGRLGSATLTERPEHRD
jgi:uncharacterized membrane protein YphA (DoxX/SURF4 family)